MFQHLKEMQPDGLIALIAAFQQDPRPEKIDLGVGVYQDEQGRTPVMQAVKAAEKKLLETEITKSYQGMAGDPVFNERITQLTLGNTPLSSERICTIQTPGGSGALRVAAEVVLKVDIGATVWVSTPTWINHIPLISSVGLPMREYPYYNDVTHQVDFDAMCAALAEVPAGDIVLLHGCCHNPSGADLNQEQWRALTELASKNGFIPLIDLAYQGLGDGLDEDVYGVRLMASSLPELIITVSCSKNFGLYRERVGAALFITEQARQTALVTGQAMAAARRLYSMPPAHGAAVVSEILGARQLSDIWREELTAMRDRINIMRSLMVKQLQEEGIADGFRFIEQQKGMFSFLGITPAQVQQLKSDAAIYMADNSRINVAGLRPENVAHLAKAIRMLR